MDSKRKKIMLLLVLAGLTISVYLTHAKLNADPFWCNFGQCGVVQASSYSMLFGVPVAAWGVAFYLTLGVLTAKDLKKLLGYALAWGIAFSTYLTYIEVFILKAICGWCVVSFGIIIVLALLHYGLPFSRPRRIRT